MSATSITTKHIALRGAASLIALLTASALAQVNQTGQAINTTNPISNTGTQPQIPAPAYESALSNANPHTPASAFALNQTIAPETLGLTFANGQALTISAIADSSPLAQLGLQVGDQIYAANGQALGGSGSQLVNQLAAAAQNNQAASLTVIRNGQQLPVNVPVSALQSVAQARNQLLASRGALNNRTNQSNQQPTVEQLQANQTGQTTGASAAAGGAGAAATGSAIAGGASNSSLNSSTSATSGTTATTDERAAINAVSGFQHNTPTATGNTSSASQLSTRGANLQTSIGEALGLTFAGTPGSMLTISSVAPNSPFAGLLQAGDQITGLDGRPLNEPMNLFNQLALDARGDQSASLSILRGGLQQNVSLSSSLLDRIAQIESSARPGLFGNETQNPAQNGNNQNQNAQSDTGQNNLGRTLGGTNGNSGEQNNLPTTVVTPNGPRIVMPSQLQAQGRAGSGALGAAVPGAKGTTPAGQAAAGRSAGGARPAGGGSAVGAKAGGS